MYYKKLAAIILFVSSHLMYASQNNEQNSCAVIQSQHEANLDKMPIKVMSMIVAANNVGERNVIPDLLDLPEKTSLLKYVRAEMAREEHQLVAVRDLRSLACVNKSLNKLVNDGQVVETFITSMADRDDVPKINIAGLMQTKGAKVWLNNYADTSGEYETFKAAQAIITISKNICKQLNQHGFYMGSEYTFDLCGRQTKEGLIFRMNDHFESLLTPWGSISFPDCANDHSRLLDAFVAQNMFKEITAHIKEVQGTEDCASRYISFFELKQEISLDNIKQLSQEACLQKIPLEEIIAKKGQEHLIINGCRGALWCLYKVHAVGNQQLPDSEWASQKEKKSINASDAMWKIMKERFKEEERIKLIKNQECTIRNN